eukprot:4485313-Amphidinium_carterae.1
MSRDDSGSSGYHTSHLRMSKLLSTRLATTCDASPPCLYADHFAENIAVRSLLCEHTCKCLMSARRPESSGCRGGSLSAEIWAILMHFYGEAA